MKFFSRNIIKRVTVASVLLPFFSLQLFADEIAKTEPAKIASSGNVLQMAFGLLIVVGFIFFISWILRRISGFSVYSNPHLKVISGLHVGQKEKVLLVQVGEQQILIGVTPYAVSNLLQLEKNISTDIEPGLAISSFSERLKMALRKEQSKK